MVDLMTTEEPSHSILQLAIQDSGIGIGAEDQQRLFALAQAGTGRPQVRGGAGLGLVISRSLCEMMGDNCT